MAFNRNQNNIQNSAVATFKSLMQALGFIQFQSNEGLDVESTTIPAVQDAKKKKGKKKKGC